MNIVKGGMKKLFLNLSGFGVGDWWVEVITSNPNCIYYFGPFLNFEEAAHLCPGYVQDLIDEGVQKISTAIKRCYPAELTKCSEDDG